MCVEDVVREATREEEIAELGRVAGEDVGMDAWVGGCVAEGAGQAGKSAAAGRAKEGDELLVVAGGGHCCRDYRRLSDLVESGKLDQERRWAVGQFF